MLLLEGHHFLIKLKRVELSLVCSAFSVSLFHKRSPNNIEWNIQKHLFLFTLHLSALSPFPWLLWDCRDVLSLCTFLTTKLWMYHENLFSNYVKLIYKLLNQKLSQLFFIFCQYFKPSSMILNIFSELPHSNRFFLIHCAH